MIQFRGFGFILVTVIYVGGMFFIGRLAGDHGSDLFQLAVLAAAHVVLSVINYLLACFLNRKELRHTVYELKLQTFVLALAVILGVVIGAMTHAYM